MRLKAFTLAETLVAMALSSLVIVMGYMGYTLVFRDFHAYSKSKGELTERIRLQNAMNADFFNAASVQINENTVLFTQADNRQVKYAFHEDNVVRSLMNVSDTIMVSTKELKPHFPGAVYPGQNTLIDRLEIDVNLHGNVMTMRFEKTYDAMTMIAMDTLQLIP